MFRLHGQVHVSALDPRPFVAAIPALVRRWRASRFEDGIYVDAADGRRREGLRVERGSHPLPGTSYRLVLRLDQPAEPADGARAQPAEPLERAGVDHRRQAAEPAGQTEPALTTTLMDVVHDDRRRFRVRFRDPDGRHAEDIQLHHPDRPDRISFDITTKIEYGWPIGGPIAVRGSLALDRLPPADGDTPQLVAEVRHRLARGKAEVSARTADRGTWTIVIDIQARGRGLARPIVAVLAPLAQSYARPQLDALLAHLPEGVDAVNRELRAALGTAPDPERIAGELFDSLLSTVAEHLPQGRQRPSRS